MQTIAITGATGFAGRAILEELVFAGHRLKCLVRNRKGRAICSLPGVEWVPGDVTDKHDLQTLVEGADSVIHLAGLTGAVSSDAFHLTNTKATTMLVAAARRAGVRTFILVSSLAAARPGVSPYARSKAIGEAAARTLTGSMKLIILRPPAVLGPGDSATHDIMMLLQRGWLPCPGGVEGPTFSWIDVDDLARFTRRMVEAPSKPEVTETSPYSGRSASWSDIATAAEHASGRKVRCIGLPGPVVRIAGVLASLISKISRKPMVFSAGKANEMLQHEWQSDTPVDAPCPLHQTLSRCFLHLAENKPT